MLRGPFEPATHDMSVFRGDEKEVPKESYDKNALYVKIKEGDRIVGDGRYAGEPSKKVVWRDEHSHKYKKFIARVSSRQETFFKGLKDWRILKKDGHAVVEAIAVIHQYDYENGHPPFEVC